MTNSASTSARSQARFVAPLLFVTINSVYPGFLIGALSVQVSAEFAVSEGAYGIALGTFFLAATVGSTPMGRLVQRVGPRRQMITLLCVMAATQLAIATIARSFIAVVAFLVIGGLVNAGNQTAVNLALTQARIPRLGLAIALKQSGMPAASMLSGIAVPVVALTIGWRWGYAFGAMLALVTAAWVARVITPLESGVGGDGQAFSSGSGAPAKPITPPGVLRLAALSNGLMSFGAGSLNSWLVASGVDAGLGDGPAGLMMGIGAACGITIRLVSGARLDTMKALPFRVGAISALIGAVAIAGLGLRIPGTHVVATLLAFAAGWIWPVFTNFGVIRRNRDAAGAATGVTQTGVYIGVFSAPLVTGALIEAFGYPVMWVAVAATVSAGALLALRLAPDF